MTSFKRALQAVLEEAFNKARAIPVDGGRVLVRKPLRLYPLLRNAYDQAPPRKSVKWDMA